MEHAFDNLPAETPAEAIARSILAELPRIAVAGLPAGMVAILRRTVTAAGLDIELVRRLLWATAGGFESEVYLRLVRESSGPVHPEPYFAFPATALTPR